MRRPHDPLRDIDLIAIRLTSGALIIGTGLGFVGNEWQELVGGSRLFAGIVGAVVAYMIANAVRRGR